LQEKYKNEIIFVRAFLALACPECAACVLTLPFVLFSYKNTKIHVQTACHTGSHREIFFDNRHGTMENHCEMQHFFVLLYFCIFVFIF
jgi:hypothetical protein